MIKTLLVVATTMAMLAGPTLQVYADDDDDAREIRKSREEQQREAQKDRMEDEREARKAREERQREARKHARDDDDD
ncbi:MAG: hypothetical protein QG599_1959 [Pseudomonadota bacterium]|nr:hypothetical protein [Pseudomonadota bacterium]